MTVTVAVTVAVTAGSTVGVVMPVLDAVDTVEAAVDSVVAELAGAPEGSRIVVVDGGSTDGTFERLASRPDVELVRQRGRGLAAARNQGVALLATDLVAFCDADDRWVTGGLGARLRHLRDHAACAVVAGAVVMRVVDGHKAPPARAAQLGRPLPGYTPGALLVRRSVFDAVGRFDERLRIAADSAWLARLLESDLRFDLLDELVLVKGVRSHSLSTDVDRYRRELLGMVRGHLRATKERSST